jgi:ABC-type uncharacterized transport system substrate-binding protein
MSLLGAASLLLLSWDYLQRLPSSSLPRVALLQHASVPVLDEGVDGIINGLAERGFADGKSMTLHRFNAEGDVGTGNTMASAMVGGRYDLLISCSTPSLQIVANANKEGKVRHVFGLVADPFSTGVGLDRADPQKHPPHLVGLGVFPPVADSFAMARRLFPGLKHIGTVWNPGEANSRAITEKAREVAKQMGLELIESAVENATGIPEACRAVIARGAQAIWIGGDITVSGAASMVLAAARQARIPVFSILPGLPDRGTLFEVGLDYRAVGKQTGYQAAEVLRGADLSGMAIRDVLDVTPKKFAVNLEVLKGLRDPWTVSPELLGIFDIVVDERGIHNKTKTRD